MAGEEMAQGAVRGGVRATLRLEGLGLLAGAVAFYYAGGHAWWLFAVLFLLPDLTFLAYLAGPRVGAVAYNAAHSTVGPLALGIASLAAPALAPFALIWAGHVGFDRALGYGLKYSTDFHQTHLGLIGRAARSA